MSTIRIVVEVLGGLVQNVYSPDWPDAEVTVLDYDALDVAEGDEPFSSTGPVDQWDAAPASAQLAVNAVADGAYLTVGDVRAL